MAAVKATDAEIKACHALFDSMPGLKSSDHPFHRWCDAAQQGFLQLVRGK